jgi:hypothetical protein
VRADHLALSVLGLTLLLACSGREPSNATVALCAEQCSGAECENTDCLQKCEAEYADAERYDCLEEYENILDCADDLEDVCAIDECNIQTSAYSICYGFYLGRCQQPDAKSDPSCASPDSETE